MTRTIIRNEPKMEYKFHKDMIAKVNLTSSFYYMNKTDNRLYPLINYFEYKHSIEDDTLIYKYIKPYYKIVKYGLFKKKEHQILEGYIMEQVAFENVY